MRTALLLACFRALLLSACLAGTAFAADPAELVVTDTVLRPAAQVPPLGANNYGGCGAIEWAANNFVRNSGNEPVYWRNLHRIMQVGPNWFEIDGPGTSWWDLWANGFLSGADVRLYRIVDKAGAPLPTNSAGNGLDMSRADHVAFVGKAQVLPEGSPGFPDGGWVATKYGDVYPNAWIRHGNLSCTDASGVQAGRTYWYTITAISADGKESDFANEVSATVAPAGDGGPHILIVREDKLPDAKQGQGFDFAPGITGGKAPLQWRIEDAQGGALALPEGLAFDTTTGRLRGQLKTTPPETRLRLKVTDAAGREDSRWYVLNPAAPTGAGKPEPPRDVKAVAGPGCVTLTWAASPSAHVVAYRLKRSAAPLAQQRQRVVLSPGAPELKRFDYAVIQKRFQPFDMRAVHPRVRGIGNPFDAPAMYWNHDAARTKLALVPHPQPLPKEMTDPGETCLQVTAGEGEQFIDQFVFIGTDMAGESIWYGQLEPGKQYRLEVWLRQEGLANNGAVTFSYGRAYPEIKHGFNVTGQWAKYTCDFTGPERPDKLWHFGHRFTFTGPGTLWLDNARVFRVDDPADLAKPYVPNPVVLNELLASQPATGPKGSHRIWFLDRDATLESITSWHANSKVRPDWRTALSGTMEMTLPMGLMFDLQTGPDPQTRMKPWLVLQHLLHSEDDWRGLIEYLAAPYDPAQDTPQAKPWAYRRFQQRGVGQPWTDEFSEITIEFGNETWHNGVFDDWLGFATRNAVWQGGREYGMFCRYLIQNMRRSPVWQAQKLDGKIRFAVGDGYIRRDVGGGKRLTYGEEAIAECPEAQLVVHANYVGPKWETGDKSRDTFDDHGVQETLLAFLAADEGGFPAAQQQAEQFAAQGLKYDHGAYEGGPSGFAIPGRDTPQQKETNERYGKSLAMAVTALDAWMRSYAYGWTDQCYFSYGQGMYWNSHTWFSAGFRPSPGWLAMALRNRYASGDLMMVIGKTWPTLRRGEKQYPLIGAYAMRDGRRWSVFVVSRKLDGSHDGQDFGDGTTPVTLKLPFTNAQRITLHKLTGDPRANNRQALEIAIQDETVPPSSLKQGALALTMPPGSVYLYVFEGAQGSPDGR